MKYTLKNKEIELNEEEVAEIIKQNSVPKEEKVVGLQIKSTLGTLLFQSTKTTWKEAVEEAIEKGTDLSYANLSSVNLSYANLRYANLSSANLSYANLRYANLSSADLRDANLENCEMQEVKFYGKTSSPKSLTKTQLPHFLNALGFKIED